MTHQTTAVAVPVYDVTVLPTPAHLRVFRGDRFVRRLEASLLAVVPGTLITAATGFTTGNNMLIGSAFAAGGAIVIGTAVARLAVDHAACADAVKPPGANVVAERPDYALTPGDVARHVEAV